MRNILLLISQKSSHINNLIVTRLHKITCIDAVRRNPVTCRATDNDVANVIKEWLKHSADHDGGRARRQRRSNPHTPAAIPAEN